MKTHAILPDGSDVQTVTRLHVTHAPDDAAFPHEAYTIGKPDIAWWVMGWECESDEDTEWSGMVNLTGRVVCVMVGDDSRHLFDPADLTPLEREAYCGTCGQVGCTHDGLERIGGQS